MHTLKTNQSFDEDGYKVTRLGCSAEEAKSDWALFCISCGGDCKTCEGGTCPAKGGEGDCACEKTHMHFWVKAGHSFSMGNKAYKLESSSREESVLLAGDANVCGMGDC